MNKKIKIGALSTFLCGALIGCQQETSQKEDTLNNENLFLLGMYTSDVSSIKNYATGKRQEYSNVVDKLLIGKVPYSAFKTYISLLEDDAFAFMINKLSQEKSSSKAKTGLRIIKEEIELRTKGALSRNKIPLLYAMTQLDIAKQNS